MVQQHWSLTWSKLPIALVVASAALPNHHSHCYTHELYAYTTVQSGNRPTVQLPNIYRRFTLINKAPIEPNSLLTIHIVYKDSLNSKPPQIVFTRKFCSTSTNFRRFCLLKYRIYIHTTAILRSSQKQILTKTFIKKRLTINTFHILLRKWLDQLHSFVLQNWVSVVFSR